jgi:hypothetical protein
MAAPVEKGLDFLLELLVVAALPVHFAATGTPIVLVAPGAHTFRNGVSE